MDGYECQGFRFYSNFDSANLRKVVFVPKNDENDTPQTTITGKTDVVDFEFNLWTKPDCVGTEFENGNRTWFYFAVKSPLPLVYVKFNITDMNKQAKLYGQGMVPVYRMVPGKTNFDRILEKPTFTVEDVFTLSFKFRMPENTNAMIYFAFTYPYPYHDLQVKLDIVDKKQRLIDKIETMDDIYYVRETVCYTLQQRKVDLLTISSYHGITDRREERLRNLFPDLSVERPYHFKDKKVIFLSARVHPGETPSSFVLNGFINLIMTRDDTVAITLRRLYVFKIIPCLNPDGVVNGHYRTDTRGVNLNRVYLNPSPVDHPPIYAARSLIRYAHYGYERESDEMDGEPVTDENIITEVGAITLEEKNRRNRTLCKKCRGKEELAPPLQPPGADSIGRCAYCGESIEPIESGLFLYLDMHGHASKKGIFMYGNHFDDLERNVNCMLLPKIMSLNNQNFHFTACNFTEKNMYLKDKRDGMSREGSGRVAVFKLTGLIQSYTLECNYNTGRLVNQLPPCVKDSGPKFMPSLIVPPKYTPHVFEEVGRALGASILDLTCSNMHTRVCHSEYHSLNGLREWLRIHCTYNVADAPPPAATATTRRPARKAKLRQAASMHSQGKTVRPVLKTRSFPTKYHPKPKAAHKQRQAATTSAAKRHKEAHAAANATAQPQPSCSHDHPPPSATSTSSSSSSSGCQAPARRKTALAANQKQGSVNFIARNIRNTSPQAKATLAAARKHKTGEIKVKEICYVQGACGKRVIATYERDNRDLPGDLIVAWENGKAPQVYTQKTRVPTFIARKTGGDGEPRQRAYRDRNSPKQEKSYSKRKLSKRTFRTATTADAPKAGKAKKAGGKKKKMRSKE